MDLPPALVPFPTLHHDEPALPTSHPQTPSATWHSSHQRSPSQVHYLHLVGTPASPKYTPAPDYPPQLHHTPLTPPLTPASSSKDNADSSASSETPSPVASRWPHSNSFFGPRHPARISSVHDSQMSIDISDDNGLEGTADMSPGMSLVLGSHQFDSEPSGGRFLLVAGVPKDATSDTFKNAFTSCGDIKGIFVRFQAQHGAIILAFYDSRHAVHAKHLLSSQTFFSGSWLNTRYVTSSELVKLLGRSPFITETDADVSVIVDGGTIDKTSLQSILASFGELKAFNQATGGHKQAFIAEYFDSRDAACALGALNNRTILGIRLRLSLAQCDLPPTAVHSPLQSTHAPSYAMHSAPSSPRSTSLHPHEHSYSDAQDTTNSSPFHTLRALPQPPSPTNMNRRISTGSFKAGAGSPPLHQSTSEQDLRRRAAAQEAGPVPFEAHVRRTSNVFGFDAVRRLAGPTFPLSQRPRAISESSASPPPLPSATPPAHVHALGPQEDTLPHQPQLSEHTMPPVLTPLQIHPPYVPEHTYAPAPAVANGIYPLSPVFWSGGGEVGPIMAGPIPVPPYPQSPLTMHYPTPYSPGGAPQVASPAAYSPRRHMHGGAPMFSVPVSHPHPHAPRQAMLRGSSDPARDAMPERNQIDLQRIADGLDTRTTVMIKNIPNKLSDKDLVEFIGRVCPRKIDFLYLRMDFQNGCNVGYAFVNFIRVQDLLHFAQAKLGVKWNMFSSEKVLQMSYANYQGKEALVEKFKNSCVMDERESWRPKIFYSGGPRQGLPEPFPSPTHLRRKERSSQNRGALFVPGPGGAANTASPNGHPAMRRPHQHPPNLARLETRY